MGVKRAPGWLTWLLLAGLAAVYAGERMLPQTTIARLILTGGGIVLVLAAVFLRYRSWRGAEGDEQHVERIFLLSYAGAALALLAFLVAGALLEWIRLEPEDAALAQRIETAAAVLGAVLLSVSMAPALAAQWAVGFKSSGRGTGAVDRLRVSQLATAGLTVGLSAPFLMLAGYVASERDKTLDLSYFRTSSPGTASQQLVESLSGPLRVSLFFQPASEVTDQVRGYFRTLNDQVGNVEIEEYDRLQAPEIAEQYRVIRDGVIILAVGDRFERVTLPEELRAARLQLRTLDDDVQKALIRVARNARTIYLTVGHGELNDPSTASVVDTTGFGSVYAIRSLAEVLNYNVQDLGLQGGLGRDVPQDAAMVLAIGPRRPFLEPELQALDRYLARGGSVMLALEPQSEFQLGPLAQRLGMEFNPTPLADEETYMMFRDNVSDRRLIITDRVTSHEALATVSSAGVNQGILFMGSGSLDVDAQNPNAIVLVRSLPSTFKDLNLDYQRQDPAEEQDTWALAAAVGDIRSPNPDEEPVEPADSTAASRMRAMVFADSELFSDRVISSLGLNQAMLADAIRWLGREESLSGETTSEADLPIRHTRNEDVAWFYSTILGAPSLVLLLGLIAVRRRRRSAPAQEAAA